MPLCFFLYGGTMWTYGTIAFGGIYYGTIPKNDQHTTTNLQDGTQQSQHPQQSDVMLTCPLVDGATPRSLGILRALSVKSNPTVKPCQQTHKLNPPLPNQVSSVASSNIPNSFSSHPTSSVFYGPLFIPWFPL